MNAILDVVFSYHGIITITMLLVALESLIFCRYVTGIGPIRAVKSIFRYSGGDFGDLRKKLGQIKSKASPASFSNPNYEDISLNGGDGRGTVSEILAQQTQLKILNGEEIEDEFGDEAAQSPIASYSDYPSDLSFDQFEDQDQQMEFESALEEEPANMEEEIPEPDEEDTNSDETEKTILAINSEMIFDGFSLGDTYEQK